MLKIAYLLTALIIGVTCYITAKRNNIPNPILWAIGGCIMHVVALAVIMQVASYHKKLKEGD